MEEKEEKKIKENKGRQKGKERSSTSSIEFLFDTRYILLFSELSNLSSFRFVSYRKGEIMPELLLLVFRERKE